MKPRFLLVFPPFVLVASWLLACFTTRAQAPPPTFTKILRAPVATDVGTAHGCAWVDMDNDGWLDLFDANYNIALQLPSRFYRNNRDGTFNKLTNGPFATYIGITATGAWGDYDNDGFPDLLLPDGKRGNLLYHNNGDGTFATVSPGPGVGDTNNYPWAAAWADYDNDGQLDLFVSGSISESPASIPGLNRLYRNNGDGTFRSITNSVVVNDIRFCVGCAWVDFNNDRFADLFVVKALGNNSGSGNALYRNNGDGSFTKLTNDIVTTDPGSSIGCAWGDYDNDGFMDLYVPNEMGQRSRLYHNNGNGTFTKITTGALVNDIAESLAAVWGDYDNDGFIDLFVANGRGTSSRCSLHHNNGDGTFTKVIDVGPVNDPGLWHGACWGDYDRDGFLDLFMSNWGTTNALYHNNANTNAWLTVRLRGTISNRSAIGAKVRVRAQIRGTLRWQHREISGGDGVVQNGIFAHFGLADATNVADLRIEWPSGITQELIHITPRQFITVTEPPRLQARAGAGQLLIEGGRGEAYSIEASTNFQSWTVLGSVTNSTGSAPFVDAEALSFPSRFYRAVGHNP